MLRTRIISLLLLLCLCGTAGSSTLFRSLPDGEFKGVEDYHAEGKWLILMVWASDCHVCNHEASQYSDFHVMHADEDAKILGISLDGWANRGDANLFIDKHQVAFDNLIAEPETFISYYQNTTGSRWVGTPTFMLFGPDGELKAKQTGAVPVHLIEQFIGQ